jgi:acetoin utilization deacetylase AcuC-like enzyme
MGAITPNAAERLGAIRDQLLIKGLLDHMSSSMRAASVEQLHAGARRVVRAGADRVRADRGHRASTPTRCMNPFTIAAARRAAGAAVLATDSCSARHRADRVLLLCARPAITPNALREWGSASSTMSRSGSAMRLEAHGLQRVALIDFDVAPGNGSEDILRGESRVLMCSIFERGCTVLGERGA